MPPKSPNAPASSPAEGASESDVADRASWWRYVVTVTGNAAQKDIATAAGLKEGSVRHLVRKMVENGEVEKIGRGEYRLAAR